MLAKEVIRKNRENFERLKGYHEHGFKCLDYDEFMKKYNMTDREIIEAVLAKGAQIEDAEEFLAQCK